MYCLHVFAVIGQNIRSISGEIDIRRDDTPDALIGQQHRSGAPYRDERKNSRTHRSISNLIAFPTDQSHRWIDVNNAHWLAAAASAEGCSPSGRPPWSGSSSTSGLARPSTLCLSILRTRRLVVFTSLLTAAAYCPGESFSAVLISAPAVADLADLARSSI